MGNAIRARDAAENPIIITQTLRVLLVSKPHIGTSELRGITNAAGYLRKQLMCCYGIRSERVSQKTANLSALENIALNGQVSSLARVPSRPILRSSPL